MYLVEIGLAGNTQSTCFGWTDKVHRKTVCFGKSQGNGYFQGGCV